MRNKFLILLAQVMLLCCQSPNSSTEKQVNDSDKAVGVAANNEKQNISPIAGRQTSKEPREYLDWRSIRINNKFPLITTVKNIEGFLGKPDSVVKVDFDEICPSDFRSEDSKIAYYGGVHFEQFGDSLDFMSIDFTTEKKIFLQSGNLKLDHATTPEMIKEHFPTIMKDYVKGAIIDDIGLPPTKELSDGQWLLRFEGGKLISFDDWFPC